MTSYMRTTRNFISSDERAWLVRLCAKITGNRNIAEDLAQETILEALQHYKDLREPQKRTQWLSGIARNICLRWGRRHGKDLAHYTPLESPLDTENLHCEERFADPFDIEIELERKELIDLLDRALATLPPETRILLVKRYIDTSPLAEIAEELGANTSAIAMRLRRGKLALQRVLSTQMQDEITAYGYTVATPKDWQPTNLWCDVCGQHHLLGQLDTEQGAIALKCQACCNSQGVVYTASRYRDLLCGVRSYRRALTRLAKWEPIYYRAGIHAGRVACLSCGQPIPLRRLRPGEAPGWQSGDEYYHAWDSEHRHGIIFTCNNCKSFCMKHSNGIAKWTPEAQRFLREHRRVRTLPEREIEANGRQAIVTGLESITDTARLELVLALDTFETLNVSGGQQ